MSIILSTENDESEKEMVNSPHKILIIRLSSIGDILLTTPFIRQLKTRFPLARIDFVVKQEFEELLKFNPHIDNLYTPDFRNDPASLKDLKQRLHANSYDVIIDLHNNLRSNFLRRGSGAKYIRKIHKNKIRQVLLVYFKINIYRDIIPIPLRYLNVGADFDVKDDDKGLEIFWDQNIVDSVNEKINFADSNSIVCFAPGAAHFTKRWPKNHFQQLCIKLRERKEYKIILLGGEADRELGNFLSENNHVIDYTGKLNLLETGYLMSRAKALVTNDTGLMHLGTAVDIPVLALFGSTVEAFGFFPFRGQAKVLENASLSCRPCTHIGRRECPKDHFKCMKEILPEQVFDSLQSLLKIS